MVSISSRMMATILLMLRLPKRQVGVDAGAQLAHIACAQQQLVACDLGVGWSFAKRRDEQFRPAVHTCWCLPGPLASGQSCETSFYPAR